MPNVLIYLWLLTLTAAAAYLLIRYWRRRPLLFADENKNRLTVAFPPRTERQVSVTILIILGLLLIGLGQAIYAVIPWPQRWLVFGLMGVGLVSFLFGGRLVAVERPFADSIPTRLQQVSKSASLSRPQLLCLFFALCFSLMAWLAAGDQLLARHSSVAIFAWFLALVLVIGGSLPVLANGRLQLDFNVDITKKDWLIALSLFVVALLLRGLLPTQYPNTFSGDEGSAGLHAILFLEGTADNWFTGGWFSFPALYYALQSVFIAALGRSVIALRLLAAVGGALAVVAVYFLGRLLFSRLAAVIAAVFLAASHYHIHMSRIGLNNVWDSFFVTLAVMGLWWGWQRGRRLGFVLCGLALGLGQYFYVSIRIVPLLFLIWAAVAFWRQRERFRARFVGLSLAAFVALVVVLPLGLYYAQHPDEFRAPYNRVTILGDRLEQMAARENVAPAIVVVHQMTDTALGFTHEPLKLLYEPGTPLLLSGTAALFLVGLLWALLHLDLGYLLLLLPLLAVIVSGGFSQDPPASQRFILALPSVVLFLALPLGNAAFWLKRLWPQHQRTFTLLVLLVVGWLAFVDVNFYFTQVYKRYALGGLNTVVATELADYLNENRAPRQKLYFFGLPRMGYFSLSTLPYLVTAVNAEDVVEPLATPPDWPIDRPTMFVFLPERLPELSLVQEAYPNGDYEEIRLEGELLYAVYAVAPAAVE